MSARNVRLHLVLVALSAVAALAPATTATAQVAAGAERRETPPRTFWLDRWRGWHFYEDPPPDEVDKRRPTKPVPTPADAAAARAPELAEFERLQKTLEEFRNVAIVRPTEANVRRYMELEALVVGRASYFAGVAQRVAWSTPELDPTVQGRPVNAKALEVFERRQQADRSASVAALAADHVLIFVYRSDCPYCQAFAPVLQAFEARHGLQVTAVSIDGGPMPGFPRARPDNGIATALRVTQVPATFLAQPRTGMITPIGFGVLSESQLLERIAIVSSPQAEASLPGATQRLALP